MESERAAVTIEQKRRVNEKEAKKEEGQRDRRRIQRDTKISGKEEEREGNAGRAIVRLRSV